MDELPGLRAGFVRGRPIAAFSSCYAESSPRQCPLDQRCASASAKPGIDECVPGRGSPLGIGADDDGLRRKLGPYQICHPVWWLLFQRINRDVGNCSERDARPRKLRATNFRT